VPTLEENGATTSNVLATVHEPVPAWKNVVPTTPFPPTREIGWRYWADLPNLGAPVTGEVVLTKPLVWSWTRNYDAITRPAASAGVTLPLQQKRRQDLYRFPLTELVPLVAGVEHCPADFVGVLPRRTEKIPNMSGCHRCGLAGTYRLQPPHLDEVPQYLSAHAGVRPFANVAAPEIVALLQDTNLGFVAATDTGSGSSSGVDRGAVYSKITHDLVGTLFRDEGTLKFRELAVSDVDLLTPLAPAVAMSAMRNEVAFFDAYSYMDLSMLAMRTVNLDHGTSARSTLRMVETDLAGPIVSAAYRDADDSYFILSRGNNKVSLHRVGPTLAVDHIATWTDGGGATDVDVTSSEEGLLAVTSRRTNGFSVVVLAIDPNLTNPFSIVSYVSGTGPLGIGATVTPEGLALDRPGPPTDRVYRFTQVGEPDITYHSTEGTGWTAIFE